jgi:alpha-mannosidase
MPGKWTFEYSIIPHPANWQSAFWHAYAFETPLRAVTTGIHHGELPSTGSFLETTPASFVISAVKRAEDGRGWVVRGYNATAEAVTATLKPWKPFKKVKLVNLAEEKQEKLAPDKSGCVTLPVGGHQIASVIFRDKNR